MPEPLTTSLVGELLTKLSAAHPRSLYKANPVHMCDVYRNGLRGLSGDAVRFAVDRAIQDDKDFPKVARLRELATDWTKRNSATLVIKPEPGAGERYCAVCGAKVEHYEISRRVVKRAKMENGRETFEDVLDEQGRPTWETVVSPRSEMRHDARKHGVYVSSGEDT